MVATAPGSSTALLPWRAASIATAGTRWRVARARAFRAAGPTGANQLTAALARGGGDTHHSRKGRQSNEDDCQKKATHDAGHPNTPFLSLVNEKSTLAFTAPPPVKSRLKPR